MGEVACNQVSRSLDEIGAVTLPICTACNRLMEIVLEPKQNQEPKKNDVNQVRNLQRDDQHSKSSCLSEDAEEWSKE